jgi:hypothetical protein
MKHAIITTLLILSATSAAHASELESDLDGYLERFDVAQLGATADPRSLETYLAATGTHQKSWTAIVELNFFIPISLDGSVTFPGTSAGSTSAQRVQAQTPSGGERVETDGLTGWIVPIRTLWMRGRWGIQFEVTFGDLDLDGDIVGRVGTPFDLGMQFWFFDLCAVYQAMKPDPGKQPWLINLFVGVRVAQFEPSLSINAGSRQKESQTYVEPLIGGYFGYAFNASWALLARLDGSGFGVSGDSEFTYNFQLGVVWKFGKRKEWVLDVGWRYMAMSYSKGSGLLEREVDLTLHGPFIALGFEF